ncbi:hypothetical protein ACHHYP_08410 [Achlya hypogyna]|uniref:Uncharacterized protein n=1 Tax=Achlya hypogyna TaxID=1202772 RepID=A0A1V9YPE9_ACHHY|nr:hypothetical protein ACHHYP_08410 [Achlya hypogyna]
METSTDVAVLRGYTPRLDAAPPDDDSDVVTVLNALFTDNVSALFVKKAFAVLLKHVKTRDGAKEMHRHLGELTVLSMLRIKAAVPVIQSYGFVLIRKISCGCTESNRLLVENGAIELISNALRRFPDDAILQSAAAGALAPLLQNDDASVGIVLNLGLLPVLMRPVLFRSEKTADQAIMYTCAILVTICEARGKDVVDTVLSGQVAGSDLNWPVLQSLVQVLQASIAVESAKRLSTSVCTALLCLMSLDRMVTDVLDELHALSTVSHAMVQFAADSGVQRYSGIVCQQLARSPVKRIRTHSPQKAIKAAKARQATSSNPKKETVKEGVVYDFMPTIGERDKDRVQAQLEATERASRGNLLTSAYGFAKPLRRAQPSPPKTEMKARPPARLPPQTSSPTKSPLKPRIRAVTGAGARAATVSASHVCVVAKSPPKATKLDSHTSATALEVPRLPLEARTQTAPSSPRPQLSPTTRSPRKEAWRTPRPSVPERSARQTNASPRALKQKSVEVVAPAPMEPSTSPSAEDRASTEPPTREDINREVLIATALVGEPVDDAMMQRALCWSFAPDYSKCTNVDDIPTNQSAVLAESTKGGEPAEEDTADEGPPSVDGDPEGPTTALAKHLTASWIDVAATSVADSMQATARSIGGGGAKEPLPLNDTRGMPKEATAENSLELDVATEQNPNGATSYEEQPAVLNQADELDGGSSLAPETSSDDDCTFDVQVTASILAGHLVHMWIFDTISGITQSAAQPPKSLVSASAQPLPSDAPACGEGLTTSGLTGTAVEAPILVGQPVHGDVLETSEAVAGFVVQSHELEHSLKSANVTTSKLADCYGEGNGDSEAEATAVVNFVEVATHDKEIGVSFLAGRLVRVWVYEAIESALAVLATTQSSQPIGVDPDVDTAPVREPSSPTLALGSSSESTYAADLVAVSLFAGRVVRFWLFDTLEKMLSISPVDAEHVNTDLGSNASIAAPAVTPAGQASVFHNATNGLAIEIVDTLLQTAIDDNVSSVTFAPALTHTTSSTETLLATSLEPTGSAVDDDDCHDDAIAMSLLAGRLVRLWIYDTLEKLVVGSLFEDELVRSEPSHADDVDLAASAFDAQALETSFEAPDASRGSSDAPLDASGADVSAVADASAAGQVLPFVVDDVDTASIEPQTGAPDERTAHDDAVAISLFAGRLVRLWVYDVVEDLSLQSAPLMLSAQAPSITPECVVTPATEIGESAADSARGSAGLTAGPLTVVSDQDVATDDATGAATEVADVADVDGSSHDLQVAVSVFTGQLVRAWMHEMIEDVVRFSTRPHEHSLAVTCIETALPSTLDTPSLVTSNHIIDATADNDNHDLQVVVSVFAGQLVRAWMHEMIEDVVRFSTRPQEHSLAISCETHPPVYDPPIQVVSDASAVPDAIGTEPNDSEPMKNGSTMFDVDVGEVPTSVIVADDLPSDQDGIVAVSILAGHLVRLWLFETIADVMQFSARWHASPAEATAKTPERPVTAASVTRSHWSTERELVAETALSDVSSAEDLSPNGCDDEGIAVSLNAALLVRAWMHEGLEASVQRLTVSIACLAAMTADSTVPQTSVNATLCKENVASGSSPYAEEALVQPTEDVAASAVFALAKQLVDAWLHDAALEIARFSTRSHEHVVACVVVPVEVQKTLPCHTLHDSVAALFGVASWIQVSLPESFGIIVDIPRPSVVECSNEVSLDNHKAIVISIWAGQLVRAWLFETVDAIVQRASMLAADIASASAALLKDAEECRPLLEAPTAVVASKGQTNAQQMPPFVPWTSPFNSLYDSVAGLLGFVAWFPLPSAVVATIPHLAPMVPRWLPTPRDTEDLTERNRQLAISFVAEQLVGGWLLDTVNNLAEASSLTPTEDPWCYASDGSDAEGEADKADAMIAVAAEALVHVWIALAMKQLESRIEGEVIDAPWPTLATTTYQSLEVSELKAGDAFVDGVDTSQLGDVG